MVTMSANTNENNQSKFFPFSNEQIKDAVSKFQTPFHLYDEKTMVENIRRLNRAFAWNPGFKEYFAVKATPNPYLLKIFKEENLGMDCSSLAELVLSEKCGITGESIMLTSNNTQDYEYKKAFDLGAIVNLDDITHIDFLAKSVGVPELVCCRYNPGPLREGNVIIGKPEDAKYGFTKEQLIQGYKQLKDLGVKRFGLHTMVASNELDQNYFVETVKMLAELAVEINREVGIKFDFLNMGGGIGIPYRPGQKPVDLEAVSEGCKEVFNNILGPAGLLPCSLTMECGRMITGPYGFLVTKAIHKKNIYKDYIGLDACMSNLMRPGMYGAYHHISVIGKQNHPHNKQYDVVGSLCENNDKFAVDRMLPEVQMGDIVVIHDTGAHGHSMGFNYNGKLRSAEVLCRQDGSFAQIRRAETLEDHFATLDFEGLNSFKTA